ncbi:MAG: phosphotransferase [Eubacterium sp.]|nr:phosphotransferase [Eubacterium sp.]
MITLTKQNIVSYIRKHVPSVELCDPVEVHLIGEGDLGADIEGDGYCNYVFTVSDGKHSVIVKQSTETLRRRGSVLTPRRNRFEYEIMQLRSAIVPQYVPKVFHVDFDNYIIVMEDVSNLKLVRFEFNKDHQLPRFAYQGAEYLAATHFYTSEFYLPTKTYRALLAHFMNAELRSVMENGIFLGIFGADDFDHACGQDYVNYCKWVFEDPDLKFQRYKLRHLFMSKSETLIHGDFHTSNIFADDDSLKVIDMEYTFGAPFSYDLGFILANILSQYCSAAFRPYDNEADRKECLAYLLSLFKMLYTNYISFFYQYWDKDAKIEYQVTKGYKETIGLDILRECLGFAACVNFSRVCGTMDTADFDFIEDNDLRTKAKFLAVDIDVALFRKWNSYDHIDQVIDDLIDLLNHRKNQ